MTPSNIINNCKTIFYKSPTAVRDDLITKNAANKIVERMQLKDTPASISKTVSQVKNGHYKGTNLMGTKETVKAFNDVAKNNTSITPKMTSTGVSSKDTARIATKTIGSQAGKLSASAVGKAASSGAVGAAISGGIEVISSGIQLANGEIDGGEFMTTKAAYDKLEGSYYYHYVQSFSYKEGITHDKAHESAREIAAEAWPGHEILVATHLDTKIPHSHFVINSASFEAGYKLRQDTHTLQHLREKSDRICMSHGYSIIKILKSVQAKSLRESTEQHNEVTVGNSS